MASWYIYKYTGERVVICAPVKARIEYRGVVLNPGDRPAIREDNGLYAVDENCFKTEYRPDPYQGCRVQPMACAMFEWEHYD